VGWEAGCGAEGSPPVWGDLRRGAERKPRAGGRGAEGERPAAGGEGRLRGEGGGRCPGRGVKDFGGAELLGVKASCPVLFPPALRPSLSVSPGQGAKGQGRAGSIHLESSLLGEGRAVGETSHALVPEQEGVLPVIGCIGA